MGGSISASGFGLGVPILGGSKSARDTGLLNLFCIKGVGKHHQVNELWHRHLKYILTSFVIKGNSLID